MLKAIGWITAGAAALLVVACAETASEPTAPQNLTISEARQPKVDVCHLHPKKGWSLRSVTERSVSRHLAHGDGVPGGDVPGMAGYVFNEGCVPQAVAQHIGTTSGGVDEWGLAGGGVSSVSVTAIGQVFTVPLSAGPLTTFSMWMVNTDQSVPLASMVQAHIGTWNGTGVTGIVWSGAPFSE